MSWNTKNVARLWWVCMGLAACAGPQANQANRRDAPQGGLAGDIHQGVMGPEEVTEYDLNRDHKPDVWSYTVKAKGPDGKDIDRVVRKELDINWDGKVDIHRYYNASETLEKEVLDLDFDGRIDQVNHYEKNVIIRKERDLDYNGQPDLWVYFEKGKLARKERDTNGDGKVDYWEYWEGDQVDRVGEDLNGDGQVDRWTKNPATSPTPEAGAAQ